MNIMAEENAIAEVMNLLEAEPAAALPAPGPDIPALAILVSSGRCKESIGTNLTHEQVRRLEDKDVMKYSKRYEAYVCAKTTEALRSGRLLAFATSVLISAKHVDFGADADVYPLDEVDNPQQIVNNPQQILNN